MQKLIDDQLAELNIQDQTQMNNIELLLPSLQAKGLAIHITNTLGQPDVVGNPHSLTQSLHGLFPTRTTQSPQHHLLPHSFLN